MTNSIFYQITFVKISKSCFNQTINYFLLPGKIDIFGEIILDMAKKVQIKIYHTIVFD